MNNNDTRTAEGKETMGELEARAKVELLPCPFCGGEADVDDNKSPYISDNWVWCVDCFAANTNPDKESAISEWNVRPERIAPNGEK